MPCCQKTAVVTLVSLLHLIFIFNNGMVDSACVQLNREDDISYTEAHGVEVLVSPRRLPTLKLQEIKESLHFSHSTDYTIHIKTYHLQFQIVKYTVGIIPYKTTNRDIGRLLLVNAYDGNKDSDCSSFSCIFDCKPKKEVRFLWTAPTSKGANCVEIRAVFMTEFSNKLWNKVSAFRCARPNHGAMPTQLPVAPCCACGQAAYVAYFQGDWTNKYLQSKKLGESNLKWSEMLGISHDDTYSLYEMGGFASAGVTEMCELSSSKKLEEEIKWFGRHSVLTVLKSRDIMAGQHVNQERSAIFTVNSTHHLVTLLTKFTPSPDWCVGVSLLDVCHRNCSWKDRLQMDLYPWDAGTDSGAHFGAPRRQETVPQRIKYITTDGQTSFQYLDNVPKLATLIVERIAPLRFDVCK